MANQGTFIVLEGSDGSGKGTQFRLLKERLQAVGYEVAVFDFPRYDEPSSYFVKKYLNGDYGPAGKISPYTASLFYALDRYEAAPLIKEALAAGKVILCNRYVGSNMGHQGGKFLDPIEQRGFFVWEDSLEYQLLGIPRPNINLFLRVPPETSFELIKQKQKRSYTDKSHDEHEANLDHLRRAVATYDTLCQLFPNDFRAIECTHEGQLLSVTDINNMIWQQIKPLLPAQPTKPGKSVTLNLNDPEPQAKTPAANADSPSFSYETNDMPLAGIVELQNMIGDKVEVDLDWAKAGYDYIIPKQLPKKIYGRFEQILESFVDGHKEAKDIIKKSKQKASGLLTPATPLAALFPIKLNLSKEQAATLAQKLGPKPAAELDALATQLNSWLGDAGVEAPSKQPEPISAIIKKIAQDHGANISGQADIVELAEVWPRNEFKLLTDAVYPHSNLSKEEIELELDKWSYQQKYDALVAAVASADSTLARQVSYSFDILADQPTMLSLQTSGLLKDVQTQPASPRFGYDTPHQLEELGVEHLYAGMFDKSLELYSALQGSEHEDQAPLATMLGHKRRWQCRVSLANLISQQSGPKDKPHQPIIEAMVTAIAQAHPIIAVSLNTTTPQATVDVEQPAKKRSRNRRHRGGRSKKS